jgi:hypothetical protein
MTLVLSIGLGASLAFSFLVLPLSGFKVGLTDRLTDRPTDRLTDRPTDCQPSQAGKLYGAALLVIYAVFLATCIAIEFLVME